MSIIRNNQKAVKNKRGKRSRHLELGGDGIPITKKQPEDRQLSLDLSPQTKKKSVSPPQKRRTKEHAALARTQKKRGRPRKVGKSTRKQAGSGKAGAKKKLGLTAIRLYNYLTKERFFYRENISKAFSYKRLAEFLNKDKSHLPVSIDGVRTAIGQLVCFGYLKLHKLDRTYPDGKPSPRFSYMIEKLYGAADQIDLEELIPSVYASVEKDPARPWELSEREKIVKRKKRDDINNLILDQSEASLAVNLCRSVGVRTITFMMSRWGKESTIQKERDIARLLEKAQREKMDLMGRIDGRTYGTLIQLDEVPRLLLPKLAKVSFMQFETSRNNFQSWLALPYGTTTKQRNRIRTRIIRKLNPDSDPNRVNRGSSGAMRWVGSKNFKDGLGWTVRLYHKAFGKIVTSPELEDAGLLASPERIGKLRRIVIRRTRIAPDKKMIDGIEKKQTARHDMVAAYVAKCLMEGFTREETLDMVNHVGGKIGKKVAEEIANRRGDSWTMAVIKNEQDWINR